MHAVEYYALKNPTIVSKIYFKDNETKKWRHWDIKTKTWDTQKKKKEEARHREGRTEIIGDE